jgi:hypothetical protein
MMMRSIKVLFNFLHNPELLLRPNLLLFSVVFRQARIPLDQLNQFLPFTIELPLTLVLESEENLAEQKALLTLRHSQNLIVLVNQVDAQGDRDLRQFAPFQHRPQKQHQKCFFRLKWEVAGLNQKLLMTVFLDLFDIQRFQLQCRKVVQEH